MALSGWRLRTQNIHLRQCWHHALGAPASLLEHQLHTTQKNCQIWDLLSASVGQCLQRWKIDWNIRPRVSFVARRRHNHIFGGTLGTLVAMIGHEVLGGNLDRLWAGHSAGDPHLTPDSFSIHMESWLLWIRVMKTWTEIKLRCKIKNRQRWLRSRTWGNITKSSKHWNIAFSGWLSAQNIIAFQISC